MRKRFSTFFLLFAIFLLAIFISAIQKIFITHQLGGYLSTYRTSPIARIRFGVVAYRSICCKYLNTGGFSFPNGVVILNDTDQKSLLLHGGGFSDLAYLYYCNLVENIANYQNSIHSTTSIMWYPLMLKQSFESAMLTPEQKIDYLFLHKYLSLKYLVHTFCAGTASLSVYVLSLDDMTTYMTTSTCQMMNENPSNSNGTDVGVTSSESLSLSYAKNSLYRHCENILQSRKYDDRCLPVPNQLLPLLITGLGGYGSHTISRMLASRGLHFPHEAIGEHGSVSWVYAANDVYSKTIYPFKAQIPSQSNSLFSPRFQQILHITRCPKDHLSTLTTHLQEGFEFIRTQMRVHFRDLSQKISHFQNNPLGREGDNNNKDRYPFLSKVDKILFLNDSRRIRMLQTGRGCRRGDGSCTLYFNALSWVFWNHLIQQTADHRLQVEDMKSIAAYVCQSLITSQKESKGLAKPLSTQTTKSCKDASNYEFKTSLRLNHRNHSEYTLRHVYEIDEEVAELIREMALEYGYDDSCLF